MADTKSLDETQAPFGMTALQRDVLLVVQELSVGGRSPSITEIAWECQVGRTAVKSALDALRDKGRVTWLPRRARSLAVLQPIAMPDEPEIIGFAR